MKTSYLLTVGIVLIIITIAIIVMRLAPLLTTKETLTNTQIPHGSSFMEEPPNISPAAVIPPELSLNNLIQVRSPRPKEIVTSPFTVSGNARGNWYFEASFPVTLKDATGKTLAQTHAQAQGEWMTEEFVPFSVILTFPQPETETGTLILQKDNPSGLPEYDRQLEIQVKFKTK